MAKKERKIKASPYFDIADNEKIAKVKAMFEDQRNFWTKHTKTLAKRFSNIDNIVRLQVDLFSDYQDLINVKGSLLETAASLQKVLKGERNKAFIKAKIDSKINLKTEKDREIFIDNELRYYKEKQNILDGQIEFVELTLKNYQNMIYGIKNRLDAEAVILNI